MKVYIASPYSKGDVAYNVKVQIDCANELMNKGFTPFTPLLIHFQHLVHPRSYEDWMKLDLEWLKSCDCVLRLEGESSGADRETEYAYKNGIPVFYCIKDLVDFKDYFYSIQDFLNKCEVVDTPYKGIIFSTTLDEYTNFAMKNGSLFEEIWDSISPFLQNMFLKYNIKNTSH